MFSIVSFATTVDFIGTIIAECKSERVTEAHSYGYPFDIHYTQAFENNCSVTLDVNFSSDAKFYVCTGVLAMLYSIAIIVVYLKFEDLYRKNENVPLIVCISKSISIDVPIVSSMFIIGFWFICVPVNTLVVQ